MSIERRMRGRVHYGWIVVAVTFVTLLAAAGIRSAPGVLIIPLEREFGWTRATVSFAVSINLFLYEDTACRNPPNGRAGTDQTGAESLVWQPGAVKGPHHIKIPVTEQEVVHPKSRLPIPSRRRSP